MASETSARAVVCGDWRCDCGERCVHGCDWDDDNDLPGQNCRATKRSGERRQLLSHETKAWHKENMKLCGDTNRRVADRRSA